MASNQPKPDPDQGKSTLDNNPCGICRSMGLPVCKGHGGGAGGGGSDDSEAQENSTDKALNSNPATLELSFTKNGSWSKTDEDFVYEFNNPNALMSLTLDMGRGLIQFFGKKDLSTEQQKALDEFYQQIKDEFNEFKSELATKGIDVQQMLMERDGNNLTIKIPNPKHYDAFVQRLMDKNLLITQVEPQDIKRMSVQDRPAEQEQEHKSTAPSPFDMSGPKPQGWNDGGE
tara:strand:+ start:3847 stop:4536 length:690 start_codon:yes stop_codon:yes gene_type:complete